MKRRLFLIELAGGLAIMSVFAAAGWFANRYAMIGFGFAGWLVSLRWQ